MSRSGRILSGIFVAAMFALLPGCGSSVPPTPGFGVPAVVKLQPSPTASMDIGSTLQFAASALTGTKTPLTTTFSYRSSNPNIVSISNSGLACAGTWDSLVTPVVCTPGGAGTATLTASSSGIVSPPVLVYVHETIARIAVTLIPADNPLPNGPAGCYTALATSTITAHSQSYQATALADDASGQPTLDISSTVGPFSWSTSQTTVVTLSPLNPHGIPNGQLLASARIPGQTQIFAFAGSASSAPEQFQTCPVQMISLATASGATGFNGVKGNSVTLTPTITDTAGNLITPTLTWSSSQPAVAAVSTSGVVTSSNAGGTSVTASCIPPGCNVNLSPAEAIYPGASLQATFTGTTTTNPFSAYVSTTSAQCAAKANCEALIVPIAGSPITAGTGVALPNVPNSMLFDSKGATAYMGSQKGLMRVSATASPPTVSSSPTVTGKVLAVSLDGTKAIISDTQSTVNQVFIFDNATGTSLNLLIKGATAAKFSPDGFKAFILAGATLYVYSTQAPLQVGTLPAAGTDVDFLTSGMFGFIAQGTAGMSYLAVCDSPSASLTSQILPVSPVAAANQIRALPDGSGVLAITPPGLTLVTTSVAGLPLPPGAQNGCPAPLGTLTLAPPVVTPIGLGQGAFTPVDFEISSDGQRAYIVPNGGSVIVYDLVSTGVSLIPLTGSPHPLAAALAPDGQTLYVSADDAQVHVINTVSGGDLAQVAVPSSSLCTVTTGGPSPTCLPDLLVVRP